MQSLPGVIGIGAFAHHSYHQLFGLDVIEQELGGIRYRIPLNGFFQTNPLQALALRDRAIADLQLGPKDRLLDLYCGGGFFALAAGKLAERVIGVENSIDSVRVANQNASLNGLKNLRFVIGDVGRTLAAFKPSDFTKVLLDPPREGCTPAVLSALLQVRVPRLVYVSCSPETLARDLRVLVDGGYRLETVAPFDMFPHTAHVEVVASLSLA